MIIGYCRVSTKDQDLTRQRKIQTSRGRKAGFSDADAIGRWDRVPV